MRLKTKHSKNSWPVFEARYQTKPVPFVLESHWNAEQKFFKKIERQEEGFISSGCVWLKQSAGYLIQGQIVEKQPLNQHRQHRRAEKSENQSVRTKSVCCRSFNLIQCVTWNPNMSPNTQNCTSECWTQSQPCVHVGYLQHILRNNWPNTADNVCSAAGDRKCFCISHTESIRKGSCLKLPFYTNTQVIQKSIVQEATHTGTHTQLTSMHCSYKAHWVLIKGHDSGICCSPAPHLCASLSFLLQLRVYEELSTQFSLLKGSPAAHYLHLTCWTINN